MNYAFLVGISMEAEKCTFLGPLPIEQDFVVRDCRRWSLTVADHRRLSQIVAGHHRQSVFFTMQRYDDMHTR